MLDHVWLNWWTVVLCWKPVLFESLQSVEKWKDAKRDDCLSWHWKANLQSCMANYSGHLGKVNSLMMAHLMVWAKHARIFANRGSWMTITLTDHFQMESITLKRQFTARPGSPPGEASYTKFIWWLKLMNLDCITNSRIKTFVFSSSCSWNGFGPSHSL